MPDIFTGANLGAPTIHTKGSNFVQPIREATPLLITKIVFALLLPLILYLLVVFSAIELETLLKLSGEWNWGFFLFLLLMALVQSLLIVFVTLQWKNHVYYLTETYVQENKGILTHSEKMYDLKNVRDITIRQGMFGRVWNYGDIIIESTAPGFHEVVMLLGISSPQEHAAFLKKFV